MNIKVLRAKTDLSQKTFGERICVKAQTVQKYESGERNVPDSIQKLIRYEFAEYLPEEERLIPGAEPSNNSNATVKNEEFENIRLERDKLLQDVELLKALADGAKNLEKVIVAQEKNIQLLEDQVKLYKERLNIDDTRSKTA